MFEDDYFFNNGFLPDGLKCLVVHTNHMQLGPTGLTSKPSLNYEIDDGVGNEATFICDFGSRNLKVWHTDLCEEAINRMRTGDQFQFYRSCFISLLSLGFEQITTNFGTVISLNQWGITSDDIMSALAEAKSMQESFEDEHGL